MSKKVAIVSDTNCGITLDEAKGLGIFLITMPFFVDGEEYFEYKNGWRWDMNTNIFEYKEQKK